MVWLGVAMLFPRPAGSASANQLDVRLTFSPREVEYRNLPWKYAFDAALDASPSMVRLGANWSEIESKPGRYDFTTVDWLRERATARQQRVLLTVYESAALAGVLPAWPAHEGPGAAGRR